jgi:tRNA-Thr(GGU) m(6)t(6)A37 methyltransferase TsaA
MNKIETPPLRFVGIIRTPFEKPEDTPIQPAFSKSAKGTVEVYPQYVEGLADLAGFSHIILVYHFHRTKEYGLKVKPYLDGELRGVFATRSPRRPNAIGISVVKLDAIIDGVIHFSGADMLNETPLLDIKPYIPYFDDAEDIRIGWLKDKIKSEK